MILGFKTVHPKTKEPTGFPEKILQGIKIHSIRDGERWREGMSIHYATGVRTKVYHQFHYDTCKAVQKIFIWPKGEGDGLVLVDEKGLNEYTKSLLAKNDGFDSVEDFWDWFDKPFHGQIIHWTDFKY